MRVRAITACISRGDIADSGILSGSAETLFKGREILEDKGIEVQTLRLSTDLWKDQDPETVTEMVPELEDRVREQGVDFLSIGPARSTEQIAGIPGIIEKGSITCSSAMVASNENGILTENVLEAARVVKEISEIARDGSKNFLFASIACCTPDIPFFPASYHGGGPPSITVGMENGDLVVRASERATGLRESGKMLTHLLENYVKDIVGSMGGLPGFKGVDLSLAPGLDVGSSIGIGVENMTGEPFGSMGTLSACAELTRSIKAIKGRSLGYSGLMLPVLEDEGLGRGADNGSYSVQDLLLYSSVCGTGLDAVPLPGAVSVPKLASTILDTASLSYKWNKPLSARLLPIPSKKAGDMTDLDSPYLRDCSILPL